MGVENMCNVEHVDYVPSHVAYITRCMCCACELGTYMKLYNTTTMSVFPKGSVMVREEPTKVICLANGYISDTLEVSV